MLCIDSKKRKIIELSWAEQINAHLEILSRQHVIAMRLQTLRRQMLSFVVYKIQVKYNRRNSIWFQLALRSENWNPIQAAALPEFKTLLIYIKVWISMLVEIIGGCFFFVLYRYHLRSGMASSLFIFKITITIWILS